MNESSEKQNGLAEEYQAVVESGLARFQRMVSERDAFEQETRELRTQIAGYKVAMEANDARILDLESRMNSARAERDQAVAALAIYETLFRAQRVLHDEFVPPKTQRLTVAEMQAQASDQSPYMLSNRLTGDQSIRRPVKPTVFNKEKPPRGDYPSYPGVPKPEGSS